MRQILLLTSSLLAACSVDLGKLRHHDYPTDAPSEKTTPDLCDASPHLDADPSIPPDAQPDLLLSDVHTDAEQDLSTHDLAPKSPIGSNCINSLQCTSGFCTNNVCCNVAQCVDTCVPDGITTCPTYSGWTCSPYGTCRAY
jgi:hypothetical protein